MKMMRTATMLLHDYRTMCWAPFDRRQPAESEGQFCCARTDTKIRCCDGDSERRRQGGMLTLEATGSGGYSDGEGGGPWLQWAATESGCNGTVADLGGDRELLRRGVTATGRAVDLGGNGLRREVAATGRAADLGGGGELWRWGGWRTFAAAGRVGRRWRAAATGPGRAAMGRAKDLGND